MVFAIALYLRTGAFGGASIDWDEADYAVAASRGVWVNWWDQSEALNGQLRHWHAPLSIYVIALSTSVFGLAEWSVRLPGVIASAAACAAIALAAADLADESFRMRLTAGAIAGVLLATAPASIGQTQTTTPHSIVELLLVLNIWCLARYLRAPSTKGAVWFGISLGAQFVTMEYGFIYSIFAIPAIVLGGVLAGVWSWGVLFNSEGRIGRLPRALYATALLAIVARVAAGGVTPPSPSLRANDAKRLAVRAVPLLPAGARVIANPLPILRYVAYLEQGRLDVQFVDFAPNDARREAQSLKRLEAGEAEWAYVRIPVGGVGESPVFKFLNARFVLADQEGNLRLYRTPPR